MTISCNSSTKVYGGYIVHAKADLYLNESLVVSQIEAKKYNVDVSVRRGIATGIHGYISTEDNGKLLRNCFASIMDDIDMPDVNNYSSKPCLPIANNHFFHNKKVRKGNLKSKILLPLRKVNIKRKIGYWLSLEEILAIKSGKMNFKQEIQDFYTTEKEIGKIISLAKDNCPHNTNVDNIELYFQLKMTRDYGQLFGFYPARPIKFINKMIQSGELDFCKALFLELLDQEK